MNDLNIVTVEGRLTRDSEMSYTGNGTALCKFSLACNRSFKKGEEWQKEVSYFDVTVWGKTAEFVAEMTVWGKTAEFVAEKLHKGSGVVVSGYLKQDRWEQEGQKRSKVGITAMDIRMIVHNAEEGGREPGDE